MMTAIKVSQLSRYLAKLVKRDGFLNNIAVEGEISNLSFSGGNVFFSLKDDTASIDAVIFSYNLIDQSSLLKEGSKVIVEGSINIYERTGHCQIIVRSLQLAGRGDLYAAYLDLKDKLKKEGLFDSAKKKTLPTMPRKIGLITSKNGAALHDVLNILSRRFPYLDIYFYPSRVQGSSVVAEVTEALNYLDKLDLDLIVLTRGGGSFEDLFEFNSEKLTRLVSKLETPLVAAIGHEVDTSLVELAADRRASTPSEAAELISPDHKKLLSDLDMKGNNLLNEMEKIIRANRNTLDYFKNELSYFDPSREINQEKDRLSLFGERLSLAMENNISKSNSKLENLYYKLQKYDYEEYLVSGYSIVKKDGNILNRVKDLKINDGLEIFMADGKLQAKVIDKVEYED